MAVVADVDADLAGGGVEYRISEIARTEIELLPESWTDVGDVVLPVLAEIRAVGIDYRGGVVVDTGDFFLVNRHHQNHPVCLRDRLHRSNGRAVGDSLDHFVPARLLLGAKIRPVEEFLQTEHLHAPPCRLFDERQVLVKHPLLDVVCGTFEGDVSPDLYQSAAHDPAHERLLSDLPRRPSHSERRRESATVFLPRRCVKKRIIRVSPHYK
jgi:hypothetical protein